MSPVADFDALSLDVGGVLVVPDHEWLATRLDGAGIAYDRTRFGIGHYLAVQEVDRCESDPEEFSDYLRGFLEAVGVPEDARVAGHDVLEPGLQTPVWRQPVPGSIEAARLLAADGVRLAATSNCDGRLAEVLSRHAVLQVGDGEGVAVEWMSDSGELGVAKPDVRIFHITADALGLDPSRVLHVGDSVHYDVEGARAAGMQAAHFDPYRVCNDETHPHVSSLLELRGATAAGRA